MDAEGEKVGIQRGEGLRVHTSRTAGQWQRRLEPLLDIGAQVMPSLPKIPWYGQPAFILEKGVRQVAHSTHAGVVEEIAGKYHCKRAEGRFRVIY